MGFYTKSANIDKPMSSTDQIRSMNLLEKIYMAVVVDTEDATYTGRIFVHIPALAAPTNVPQDIQDRKDDGVRTVLLLTPFGGTTDPLQTSKQVTEFGENETSKGGTAKSFGMWPQPPAKGTTVLVAYSPSADQGFLLGGLMSYDRNFMMGGRASCPTYGPPLAPAGEKNPHDTSDDSRRPYDKHAWDVLVEQGLHEDMTRGHSMSTARRETPSRVFGITTSDGHVFTMDDGTEEGESKNVRLRTRNGAQILMDDTNEFIFITNHKGNSWIEIDGDGNIDVYAKGKISMHTEDDFNIHANGDINMQADKNINMKAIGDQGIRMETTVGDIDQLSARHWRCTAQLTTNILSSHHIETAGRIDMNGPQAARAQAPFIHNLPANKDITVSIDTRVPEHHPWEGVNAKQTDWTKSKGDTI